jgi:hypothetical protein
MNVYIAGGVDTGKERKNPKYVRKFEFLIIYKIETTDKEQKENLVV